MATLRIVHPWPAQGRADRPSDEDEVADLAIRGCRSVAELYSESVAALGLPNRVSELRLFFHHDPALEDVRADLVGGPTQVGFEAAHVLVPTCFASLAWQARARTLLEVVHGLVVRMARRRGWEIGALAGCRQDVIDRGLEYRWRSRPTASPDRRHQAQAEFRLLPDGYGRARLCVVRRADGTTVGTTAEALAFCTSAGFRRAAASLHWEGADSVSLVPYDWVPASRGGLLRLSREDGVWRGAVQEFTSVRPVPAGDAELPALTVHIGADGATS